MGYIKREVSFIPQTQDARRCVRRTALSQGNLEKQGECSDARAYRKAVWGGRERVAVRMEVARRFGEEGREK